MTGDAARASRLGLLGVLVAGIRQRNPSAVVNTVVTLVATVVPSVIERRYDVEFRPWQRLYLNTGMLAHAVGMLGPYDEVWWWDHLTHTYSSTLLGGAIHVAARRRGHDPRPRVLAGVLVAGLLWELVEYAIHRASRAVGLEPLLVSYGPKDTLMDLLFDLVGAILVLLLADRLLPGATDPDGGPGGDPGGR